LVRVEGFHKRYGRHEAVCGVDLTILPGEIYGLIGADGAGKSSLMKAIAGVLSYDAGRVNVFNVDVDSERAAERVKQRVGFMPQGLGLNLYPSLSVEENVDFFARLRLVTENDLSRRKKRLLAMTRLDRFRTRPMQNLSGGMKQKLGLVCTLIHEPRLVVLDEPTTGVDPVSRRDFWSVLAELLQEQGITALVSTAYLDEASRFRRITLLHQGRVLAEGETDAILAQVPGTKVEVTAEPQLEAMGRLKSRFSQVEACGPSLEVFADGLSAEAAKQQIGDLLDGLKVTDLRAAEAELEDVFIALLRRDANISLKSSAVIELIPELDSPSAADGIAIEAQQLVRDFGSFRAVDRVTFQVNQGEIFGLLGANGAGKTTVIKMLTGLLKPSAGEGRVAGADMRGARQTLKNRIGYMSQAFSLYQDMTVLENIRLYAGIYGLGRAETRDRTAWVLKMSGLQNLQSDQAASLPMGMRQRLALGCALVHNPRILFLDEPTSGVDPIGRRHFWELLLALARRQRVAILVTTHYMNEAEHCDRIALMYDGRIVSDAAPATLKSEVEREAGSLLALTTDRPLEALKQLQNAGFDNVALFGKRVHVLTSDPVSAKRQIREQMRRDGNRLIGVEQRPLSMENVFVYRVLQLERQQARAS